MIRFKAFGAEFSIDDGVVSGPNGDAVRVLNRVFEMRAPLWDPGMPAVDRWFVSWLVGIGAATWADPRDAHERVITGFLY